MSNAPDFELKAGDTTPPIRSTLRKPNGESQDLTGADVRFTVKDELSGEVVLAKAAEVVTAGEGEVRYSWDVGDTEESGAFLAEWEVTFNPGTDDERESTWPNHDYIDMYIHADL